MKRKCLGILQAIWIAVTILSGAIAIPVLFRPFFYWHISPLDLTNRVGLTVGQIKTAYNEMMRYCIGLTDTFSVGVLPFSPEGASHFADVRKLFLLDLRVFLASGALLVITWFLNRKNPIQLGKHTPGFWASVGLGGSFVTLGILVALDFDRAFTLFHKLFFPGKSNWVFYPSKDPVIRMLPEEFFRNCALLILVVIVVSCCILLLQDRKIRNTRVP